MPVAKSRAEVDFELALSSYVAVGSVATYKPVITTPIKEAKLTANNTVNIQKMLSDRKAMEVLADALGISRDHLKIARTSEKCSIDSGDKPIRVIQYLKDGEYALYMVADTKRQLTFFKKRLKKLGLTEIAEDVLRLSVLPDEAISTEIRRLLGKRSKRTRTGDRANR